MGDIVAGFDFSQPFPQTLLITSVDIESQGISQDGIEGVARDESHTQGLGEIEIAECFLEPVKNGQVPFDPVTEAGKKTRFFGPAPAKSNVHKKNRNQKKRYENQQRIKSVIGNHPI